MKKRRCKNKNCRCLFAVNPRHPNQQYCSKKKCQRVRKTLWQNEKLANDEAYRKNKADSQARWAANNPWYWKNYREQNPSYTKRNCEKQKERDQLKRDLKTDTSILHNLAKMDASIQEKDVKPGIYKLIPAFHDNLVKMDVLTVKIERISALYG